MSIDLQTEARYSRSLKAVFRRAAAAFLVAVIPEALPGEPQLNMYIK